MKNKSQSNTVDTILAQSLVLQAEIEVLLDLIEEILRMTGCSEIDGLEFREWWKKEKCSKIERVFISMEDKNPVAAAYLQNALDESRA